MILKKPLIAFYIRSCLAGFALAAVFVGLIVGFDVAGLRGLVFGSPTGLLALFLLWFFNGIVFSGAQASVSLLLMSEDETREPPRGGPPQPVRVAAQSGRRARL